jgi:glycine hydroxymethyltransferase
MEQVAGFIAAALADPTNEANLAAIKGEVNTLMRRFPLYAHRLK